MKKITPAIEKILEAAGWRKDFENNWKRGYSMLTEDGFGWMMFHGPDCVWNDEELPPSATMRTS